jgi:hypothetical protein
VHKPQRSVVGLNLHPDLITVDYPPPTDQAAHAFDGCVDRHFPFEEDVAFGGVVHAAEATMRRCASGTRHDIAVDQASIILAGPRPAVGWYRVGSVLSVTFRLALHLRRRRLGRTG